MLLPCSCLLLLYIDPGAGWNLGLAINPKRLDFGWLLALCGRGWEKLRKTMRLPALVYLRLGQAFPVICHHHPYNLEVGGGAISH